MPNAISAALNRAALASDGQVIAPAQVEWAPRLGDRCAEARELRAVGGQAPAARPPPNSS